MPLQLPNLDDRKFADLVQEARAFIPTHAPDWTNHNASDPGITLVEVFAYLTEMLIYRLNRVSDDTLIAFLKLLNGPEWKLPQDKTLTDEIRDTMVTFREPNRAVTGEDFERLALAADPRVKRARCVPRRNLEAENANSRAQDKPGHVSVIIIGDSPENGLQPGAEVLRAVADYLEPRRLLTTRVHVVGPRYVSAGVRLTLCLKPDAEEETVRKKVVEALQDFLNPLSGGPDGMGWPFGRNIYVSEIYGLLDCIPGVDYVTPSLDQESGRALDELVVEPVNEERLQHNASGELMAVEVKPDELVAAVIVPGDITIVSPIKA